MRTRKSRKAIIWYDDHFKKDDRYLLEDMILIVESQKVDIISAATQGEFSDRLKQYESRPRAISGLLLDLMLTTGHGVKDWRSLGFESIEFQPYLAGRQVLEILKLPDNLQVAPTYVKAFSSHSVAVLTAASEDVILQNIPRHQRAAIPTIQKDEDAGSENSPSAALATWLMQLPDAEELQ
jgi:hypothetical protein